MLLDAHNIAQAHFGEQAFSSSLFDNRKRSIFARRLIFTKIDKQWQQQKREEKKNWKSEKRIFRFDSISRCVFCSFFFFFFCVLFFFRHKSFCLICAFYIFFFFSICHLSDRNKEWTIYLSNFWPLFHLKDKKKRSARSIFFCFLPIPCLSFRNFLSVCFFLFLDTFLFKCAWMSGKMHK